MAKEQTKEKQKDIEQQSSEANSGKSKKQKKQKKLWQKILSVFGWIFGVLIVLAAALFGWLTITEYKPADIEDVTVEGEVKPNAANGRTSVMKGDTVNIMTWNIGYGALGDNADFFMDGGKEVNTADEARVKENLDGIVEGIRTVHPDVIFLQEIDKDSYRSHGIDETEYLKNKMNEGGEAVYSSSFAYNFKVKFIPYPIPPIGKVNSGISIFSTYETGSSSRISLPCPFTWPVRLGQLKRCLLVNRVPVVDENGKPTGKELVLVNLHLEAFDSGEGKIEQTKALRSFLQQEVDKGNYVIAGGDFNQSFTSIDRTAFPDYPDKWHPGRLDVSEFGDDFELVMDNSTPSGRSLDQSYVGADKENFQYYLIDGFIVSKNINVNYYFTVGLDFKCSDHNPVVMSVELN